MEAWYTRKDVTTLPSLTQTKNMMHGIFLHDSHRYIHEKLTQDTVNTSIIKVYILLCLAYTFSYFLLLATDPLYALHPLILKALGSRSSICRLSYIYPIIVLYNINESITLNAGTSKSNRLMNEIFSKVLIDLWYITLLT